MLATGDWFPLGLVVTFRGLCRLWVVVVVVRYRVMMHLGTLESTLKLLPFSTDFRIHRILDNVS